MSKPFGIATITAHAFDEGARGVRLAELGLESWREWVDAPELEA